MTVAEIVGATILGYKDCLGISPEWRNRAQIQAGKTLYSALVSGCANISEEYEQHYEQYGSRFAVGDGISGEEYTDERNR